LRLCDTLASEDRNAILGFGIVAVIILVYLAMVQLGEVLRWFQDLLPSLLNFLGYMGLAVMSLSYSYI